MPTTLATRKPVEELTVADLEAFPVWEFAIDGEGEDEEQDETWVRPLAGGAVPAQGDALCVAAAVRLAGGPVYPAVLFCDADARGIEVSAVALLTTGGRVLFTGADTPGEIKGSLKRLGLARAAVFPLAYCTRAPLAANGEFGRGVFGSPA
jgi:hypothetical protein